jgi:hypothetical protein
MGGQEIMGRPEIENLCRIERTNVRCFDVEGVYELGPTIKEGRR